MCLLPGTASFVSDVANGPLGVFFTPNSDILYSGGIGNSGYNAFRKLGHYLHTFIITGKTSASRQMKIITKGVSCTRSRSKNINDSSKV